MKTYILILLIFMSIHSGKAQSTYLEQINIEHITTEKTTDRQVKISMTFDLSKLDIESQHSLRLVPVLEASDGKNKKELEPVIINGKIRNRVHNRLEKIGHMTLNPEAQQTLLRKNNTKQEIEYKTQIPFRKWMAGGIIRLNGYTTGCRACKEGNEHTILADSILPIKRLHLKRNFLTAQHEEVKKVAESRSARLQFRLASSVIDPNFQNNQSELAEAVASVRVANNNPDFTITGIFITGYASPEGGFAMNRKLSENRARAFAQYLVKASPQVNGNLFHVSWEGEDWTMLREEVERSNLNGKEKIIDIIDNCKSHPDSCEARFKTILPTESYLKLINEIYPMIRRNEYRIEYTVRAFSEDESLEMLYTHPELMNVYEIQKVANTFQRDSEKYLQCWLIASSTFPDNLTARNNAALLLSEKGRTEEALKMVEASDDAELLNLKGTIYAENKKWAQAEEAFKQAEIKGSKTGSENLRLLHEYLEFWAEGEK